VIATDAERSADIAQRLKATKVDWAAAANLAPLAADILATVADKNFPGALVPGGTGDEARVYAIAPTSADWRRLSPIVMAFAGPTITSFDGSPTPLDPKDPAVALINEAQAAVTGVLRLPSEPKQRLGALRGLSRARETLARAPDLQRRPSEPTSWLLAEFQDQLNVGARDQALALLRRLASELRLDALNIRFLEVQALAHFGEWQAIVGLTDFASLCQARRPPAITAILLQALYEVHLAARFDEADEANALAAYEKAVRPIAQSMLGLPAPPNLRPAGWRIFAFEAWVDPTRGELIDALALHQHDLGWLADKVEESRRGGGSVRERLTLADEAPPLEKAREALSEAEESGNLDAVAHALALLNGLAPEQLKQLQSAEPFRSMIETVEEVAPCNEVPGSWTGWLASAADPNFTTALSLAQRGMDEWPPAEALADPTDVKRLTAALEAAQEDPLAAERSSQALPFMVGWLKRDVDFPRSTATPVYSSLLTLLALGPSRGRRIYESSQVLVEALLGVGLDARKYRDLLDDIDELIGSGLGVEMVYWLLEIIEDLYRYASPAADAREALIHKILARLVPITARLSSLQRAAIRKLADELGWSIGGLVDLAPEADDQGFAARLSGKRIAIYTLTESSSRQAKEALEALCPNVIVECSADHGGTARLRAMAEGADLFIMTSLSAKHAATDFIRDHRGNRPLGYAQGRGLSSILRAIEDHLRSR
jgi:hypothetical protein